ncbi:hypothetical protein KA089_00885 [Candidatus Woesebacteria bacterium]|nr:hypothetical protein [Candidatus Woesebacteria bacterium]
MKRSTIEQFTASIAVLLLFLLTVTGIIYFADLTFKWDLFAPNVEKALGFIMISGLVIIISSVMVNIMINLSIIASNSEKLRK